jgi:ribosomal protein S27AE
MMMWRLRGCPKCGGDVFLEKDISGWYERCLQCGYNRDMLTVVEVKQQPTGKKKEPALPGS